MRRPTDCCARALKLAGDQQTISFEDETEGLSEHECECLAIDSRDFRSMCHQELAETILPIASATPCKPNHFGLCIPARTQSPLLAHRDIFLADNN
jgi:hypothetical protein